MKKFGFCKRLLIAGYLILLMLMGVFAAMSFREADMANLAILIGAWIAQLGINSGAYYWKAFQSTAPVWEPMSLLWALVS